MQTDTLTTEDVAAILDAAAEHPASQVAMRLRDKRSCHFSPFFQRRFANVLHHWQSQKWLTG